MIELAYFILAVAALLILDGWLNRRNERKEARKRNQAHPWRHL